MKESKMIKGVVATIAVVAFSAPAFASADAGLKGRMEKVLYADLNVDRKRGAEILYQRLQQASKRVCGVESIRTVRGARIEADQRDPTGERGPDVHVGQLFTELPEPVVEVQTDRQGWAEVERRPIAPEAS